MAGSAKTYKPSTHQKSLENGCADCHMPAVERNMDVGDHSFAPQMSACTKCHDDPATVIQAGIDHTTTKLKSLRKALNLAGLLSRDGLASIDDATLASNTDLATDVALPQKTAVPAALAGALYNYFLVARGGAMGAHNPFYTRQLLYDSIEAAGGGLSNLDR